MTPDSRSSGESLSGLGPGSGIGPHISLTPVDLHRNVMFKLDNNRYYHPPRSPAS